MKVYINKKTGLKEVIYPGRLISIGLNLLNTRNLIFYRYCKVEIIYPDGKKAIIVSKLWESTRELNPNFFKEGLIINLVIQYEGEYKGYSTIELKTKSYSELIESHPSLKFTYEQLLSMDEWISKRNEILTRDKNICINCKHSSTNIFDLEETPIRYVSKREHEIYVEDKKQLTKFNLDIITEYPIYLHIHHRYYIQDKLPWNYNNDALITLCNLCHNEVHQNETIKIYDNETLKDFHNLTPCNRCHGTGSFPEFNHIEGGICFECRGERFTTPLINNNHQST